MNLMDFIDPPSYATPNANVKVRNMAMLATHCNSPASKLQRSLGLAALPALRNCCFSPSSPPLASLHALLVKVVDHNYHEVRAANDLCLIPLLYPKEFIARSQQR